MTPTASQQYVRFCRAPDGASMIVEPSANDSLQEDSNPVGPIYYSASTLLSTPCSRSQEVALCLGAQAGERRIREVVRRGGFARFRHAALTRTGDLRMTRKTVFTTAAARPPATYSQAVRAAGLVFVSGTLPHDPDTGALEGATIQEQTRRCLRNIEAILDAAGSSLEKVVSVTVLLADENDFAGMNEEYSRWFPSDPPARQGAKLPVRVPGLRISIAAIAEA